MLDLTLRHAAYLVAAADVGTMTGAADTMHVSQSAISTAVADLERLFGTRLFVRQGARGLQLTPDGERFAAAARDLLAHAERVEDEARARGTRLSGRLVVGCFRTAAPYLLPVLLESFQSLHPEVRLDFIEGPSPQIEAGLVAGHCEAAILYNLNIAATIATEPLYATRPYALVGKDHPLADQTVVTLAELAEHPMILLDVPPSAPYLLSIFAEHNLAPEVRYRTSSYELVRSLVARGLGFALLISRPAGDLSYEGQPVVVLPIAGSPRSIDVVLTWPRDGRLTARARAFLDHCRTTIPGHPATQAVHPPSDH